MSELSTEKTTGMLSETLRETLHRKEEICAALENLAAAAPEDYAGEVARLSAAYAEADVPPEFAELLDKRFAEAVGTARAGEELCRAKRERAAGLSAEVDALLAADELATLPEVLKLEQAIAELFPGSELTAKLAPLKAKLEAEDAAVRAAEAAVIALAEELETLTAAEDIAPLNERKSAIEAAFAELVNIPRKAARRYEEAHRKASIRLAQHFETLDLARWESYTRKLDLCAQLEKLLALPESGMSAASKTLNEIREQWKALGSVPREKSEEINPRYLDLSRQLQHKVDEFFARKRQTQKLAAAEKEKLCAAAEELSGSTDWKATAEKMRELQAQWKQLPRSGGRENELFQRFHAAADAFFSARKAAFDARDKRFGELEKRKEALIAEAEGLADFRRAKQLRDEYRAVGFCGRNDQALYERFNAAMDRFFTARREENTSKVAEVRQLLAELDAACSAPAESLPRVREIREKLRALSCRDTRNEEQSALRRFDDALNAVRRREQRRREENSESAAMTLAQCLKAWKETGAAELPPEEVWGGYPKLKAFASALAAAIAGDAKAADKVEKLVASARSDRERVCSELEKVAGIGKPDAAADLAQELQFAMLGNFGKDGGVAPAGSADPHRLCAEFAAAGVVMPEELAEFQARLNAAKTILFGE
ncbi:MAG: DUF349 domain-containing protein [Lentisphaeria bacterium]|nr:DUF349 domain-containing protein [Lentisphaeria bacterium]